MDDPVLLVQRPFEGVLRLMLNRQYALNGVTHGVGARCAAAADIRIACAQTEFRVAAALHGPAEGAWQLPHIVGAACAK